MVFLKGERTRTTKEPNEDLTDLREAGLLGA